MGKSKILLLSIMVTFIFVSCTSEPETYTFEVINGVRYVHNIATKWGDEPEVELELVRKMGGMEETDENYMFYKPFQATLDKHGNIYIVETGNFRVQKYDKDGKYLATFGSKGQGPGEFEGPQMIGIVFEEFIYIGDNDNNKIEVFDLDGNYLDGIRFNSVIGQGHISGKGNIFVQYQMKSGDMPAYRVMVEGRFDKETEKIIRIENESEKIMMALDTYPWMTSDSDDNYYFNAWHENRIDKYSPDGMLMLRISRELPQEPGMNRYKNLGWETNFSWGIGIDHRDRIWSLTVNRNKEPEEDYFEDYSQNPDILDLEIYDADGILLGRIRQDHYSSQISVVNDIIFLSDFRNHIVYQYKIIEK
ncbi:MAG: 6-bladed beta-propeller [bacterium]|nr:6-bladed beta-propeller [bacterium]